MPRSSRPRLRSARAAALAATLLVAGACGGDDDDAVAAAGAATTTTAAAPTTVTTPTTAAAPPTTGPSAPAPPTTAPPATGPPTTGTTAKAAAGQVAVAGFTYKPASLAVTAGTVVTWTNMDDIQHTATSGISAADASGVYTGTKDGMFDGDMPVKGETFSFTFPTAGTYKYFCSRHNNMIGEVVVS